MSDNLFLHIGDRVYPALPRPGGGVEVAPEHVETVRQAMRGTPPRAVSYCGVPYFIESVEVPDGRDGRGVVRFVRCAPPPLRP